MSWISNQWGRDFLDDAETKVKQLVCLFLYFYLFKQHALTGCKMMKYRERAAGPEEQPPPDLQPEGSTPNLPTYSLAEQYGLTDDDMDIGGPGENEQTVEQEYQAYITATLSPKSIDILKFWEASNKTGHRPSIVFTNTNTFFQISSTMFPTLFAMAMDYLPIQASAVSCERVFSSSAETDTKRRNRINPLLMESLQMVKYNLKKERLNFTEGWQLKEKDLTEDDPEEDLLRKLLDGGNMADIMDLVMQSIEDYD